MYINVTGKDALAIIVMYINVPGKVVLAIIVIRESCKVHKRSWEGCISYNRNKREL